MITLPSIPFIIKNCCFPNLHHPHGIPGKRPCWNHENLPCCFFFDSEKPMCDFRYFNKMLSTSRASSMHSRVHGAVCVSHLLIHRFYILISICTTSIRISVPRSSVPFSNQYSGMNNNNLPHTDFLISDQSAVPEIP